MVARSSSPVGGTDCALARSDSTSTHFPKGFLYQLRATSCGGQGEVRHASLGCVNVSTLARGLYRGGLQEEAVIHVEGSLLAIKRVSLEI